MSPMDLYLQTQQNQKSNYDITYYNANKYFYVSKSIVPGTLSIDAENAKTEYVDIKGNEAFMSIKPNQIILIWVNNDILYKVYGNIDKETIIKIAENME